MIIEKNRGVSPRFLFEGYALYEGDDFFTLTLDDKEIKIPRKNGMNFIGVKQDAPLWAHDECKEYFEQLAEKLRTGER